jgi:hypothetical protein
MKPIAKNTRNEGQKSRQEGQPTEEMANKPSSNNYSSFYGDKKIVDASRNPLLVRYLCDEADESNVRSRRRSQNFFERGWYSNIAI